MNNFYQKIQNAAHRLRLTPTEKQHMRVALYEAMKQSPATASGGVPQDAGMRVVKSPYVFVSPRFAGAFAVLLILILGSGTAYAAQGALPGSPLYPVKVNVNDAVRVALATTPQQKALANAAVAQERLDEAQALEAQGRLDATTTAELQQNFDEHAAIAIALAASSTPAPLAVAGSAPFEASTTVSPEEETASSSAEASTTSSSARARFMARPFMKASTSTTTASTSPAASTTEATTAAASQEESAVENLTTTLERQRQQFDAIREKVEAHAGHGGRDSQNNGTSTSSEATSSQAASSSIELNLGF